jgi:hypothetical protein
VKRALKAIREMRYISYGGTNTRFPADSSAEIMQARRQ